MQLAASEVQCTVRVLTTFEKVLSVIFDAKFSKLCNFPSDVWKIKHWQNGIKHWKKGDLFDFLECEF